MWIPPVRKRFIPFSYRLNVLPLPDHDAGKVADRPRGDVDGGVVVGGL